MSAYQRARHDPDFLAAVAAAYRGPHDALDALRWLEDPDAPGHDGTPSPYADLAARRAALYRPGTDPGEAERLAALLAARDADREALLAAVTAAEEALRAAPVPADPAASPAAPAGRPRWSRRRWATLLLAAPAALLAYAGGTVVGPVIGSRAVPPTTAAVAEVPHLVVLAPTGGGALAVFDRSQRADDVPTVALHGDLVAGTFRRLAALPGQGVVLYAARTTELQVCLAAVTVDAHVTASCAREADFRRMPCSLDLSVTKDPTSDDPRDIRSEVVATWAFDGSLKAGAVS